MSCSNENPYIDIEYKYGVLYEEYTIKRCKTYEDLMAEIAFNAL